MIVRSWTGYASTESGPTSEAFLQAKVIPELQNLAGIRGICVLLREIDEGLEFRVNSRWESREAIHALAGEDISRAVVPPEARRLLLRFDDKASHFEEVLET